MAVFSHSAGKVLLPVETVSTWYSLNSTRPHWLVPERPPPAAVAVTTASPSGAVGDTFSTSSTGSVAPAASGEVRLQVSVAVEQIQPVPGLAPASEVAVTPAGSTMERFRV